MSTFMVTSGKWYAEITFHSDAYIGVSNGSVPNNTWGGDYSAGGAWVLHPNGQVYHKNNSTDIGVTYSAGDTVGIAFDADTKTLTFYRNGNEVSGTYSMPEAGDDLYGFFLGGDAGSSLVEANFGATPFTYQAPAGYLCLVDTNMQ